MAVARHTRHNSIFSFKVRRALTGYVFIAPLVIVFGTYYVYAIIRSTWMSFTDFKFLEPQTTQFVGLANYGMALRDEWVLAGMANAAYFVAVYYPGLLILPLVVAIALDRVVSPRVAGIYRTLLYVPAVVPGALVFKLWAWMYMPTIGLANYLVFDLLHLTSERISWLSSATLGMPAIAFVEWWWFLGAQTLFYLVGLGQIPVDYYEAARLDGATEWQVIWHITLPLLKGTILVWAVLRIGAFGVLTPMLIMTGSSPTFNVRHLTTWAVYAYDLAFRSGRMPMGYATAVSWLGSMVMVALAFVIRRFLGTGKERA